MISGRTAGVACRVVLASLLRPMSAQAHVPHDTVLGVAAPRDLDPGVPWLLLLTGERYQALERSMDGGHGWESFAADALIDDLVGVAVRDDGTWLAAAADRLWWSRDAGETWTSTAAPARVTTVAGGRVLVVGSALGLHEVDPDDPDILVSGAGVLALQGGVDGAAAVDAEGQVWADLGDGWGGWGTAPGEVHAAAVLGDAVYVGGNGARLWRSVGAGWIACAPLPGENDVVRLAAGDGAVYAATGGGRVVVADAACAAWSDIGSPLVTEYGTVGGATSPGEGAAALAAAGGTVLHAGWAGVAIRREGAWYEPSVLPPDFTRGLVCAPGEDPRVYVGTYAAGVIWTDDGGRTWEAPAQRMTDPNVQRVLLPLDAADTSTVLAVSDHAPWASADAGWQWRALPTPTRFPAGIAAWDAGAILWSFVDPDESHGPPVFESLDGGSSWRERTDLTAALGRGTPTGVVDGQWACGDRVVVASAPSRAVCGGDDGNWATTWDDPAAGAATAPVIWGGSRILFADSSGVHRSDDGVVWQTWAGTGEDVPRALGVVGDLAVLVTRSGRVWTSVDGGEVWAALDARLPAAAFVVNGRVGEGGDLQVLIGALDGVYTLVDPLGAATIVRFAPYQRVDDRSPFLRCDGCEAPVEHAGAGMSRVTGLGAGGVARVSLRGDQVRVLGTATSSARAEVWVDGARRAVIYLASHPDPAVLAEVTGLPDGWHDVEVRATAPGVAVDAIEASGEGVLLDVPLGGCGCGGGGEALVGVGLVGLGRRRGHRACRIASSSSRGFPCSGAGSPPCRP